MMIRIDKCQTFGMRKENDIYKHYKPVITTSDTQVPAVKIGGSFKYLGKIFNSNMNTDEAKEELSNKLYTLLTKLSNLVTRPQIKIKILKLVVYPRISFELKTYNFSLSWIGIVLDGKVHSHVRQWLELPISSCVNEVACLPIKMCGLELPSVQSYALNLRLTVRSSLKQSLNTDIRQVWNESTA